MSRIPTTVVGSYPQPDWLVDKTQFQLNAVPRVRMRQVWRVAEPWLREAQDDAVRVAVSDMERAGIDVITDGEQRRESYFNEFANALEGLDLDRPGTAINRRGVPTPVPRVVGPIARARPVNLRDAQFLRAATDRPIKVTVPGPFTMAQLAQDDYYRDQERLAQAYAVAVNAELRELEAVVDVLQLDEPALNDPTAESPGTVAARLEAALRHVTAARLVAAPDCGMKYLPRDLAFAKLRALAEGARGG